MRTLKPIYDEDTLRNITFSHRFPKLQHGWAILRAKPGDDLGPFTKWNLSKTSLNLLAIFTLAGGLLIIFPETFFIGNIINALLILVIMLIHLKYNEIKPTLMEIPFLLIPLVMMYIGYPLS